MNDHQRRHNDPEPKERRAIAVQNIKQFIAEHATLNELLLIFEAAEPRLGHFETLHFDLAEANLAEAREFLKDVILDIKGALNCNCTTGGSNEKTD